MALRIWAIRCAWCTGWFFICADCYRGHRYFGKECRKAARDEQCRRARAAYLGRTIEARKKRAAATAACRERRRRGVPPRHGRFARSNGSRSRSPQGSVLDSLPRTEQCMCCKRLGEVRVRPP